MKQGSFTQQVKDEICLGEYDENQLTALLSGFIKTNGIVSFSSKGTVLILSTENSKIAKLIYQAFSRIFNIAPTLTYSRKIKLDKCVVYHVSVNEKVEEIQEYLELGSIFEPKYPKEILRNEGSRFFLAGVFLASGSVNSPRSENYHLQMIINKEEDAKFILKLLNKFKNERTMDFKMIARRNKYVVYLKKADQITIFLALCNASISMLQFENARVEKDCINSENRYQICLTANYQKTLASSLRQAQDIELLEEKVGLDSLEFKMQIVAKTRMENMEAPLSQIASLVEKEYDIKMSKSAVNRIFDNIHALASCYKEENKQ